MKQEYDFSAGARGRFFRKGDRLRLPSADGEPGWAGPADSIGRFVDREAQNSLNAYREQPELITEHAHLELDTAQGGYADRQLFELIQNSADAQLGSQKGQSILVRLTSGFLYCADDGNPIDVDGVKGLMFDRMSSKRNTSAIGRFGRGFKSVLRVTDAPEFYSRSGSFRFDKRSAAERIAKIKSVNQYPVLRLPVPVEPEEARQTDEELRELMSWATNIVRLPLRAGMQAELARQIEDFPPEFMLFVDHVRHLTLEHGDDSRSFMLHRHDGELRLDTGKGSSRWRRHDTIHPLSAMAKDDWQLHDRGDKASVSWAIPLDRLDHHGHFWAFFPTNTASLVAGILNAPWKTNEDRQNLLPGPYNTELIRAAAEMIAEKLPQLATDDDPARHLDALPRRHEAGDSKLADLLREALFSALKGQDIVPGQDGKLRQIEKISYLPTKLTRGPDKKPLDLWEAFPGRPIDWLHHKALTRKRLASIDRLFPQRQEWSFSGFIRREGAAPREDIACWLQVLVAGKKGDEAIRASKAAIQTAAAIPSNERLNESLGDIVFTANCGWETPDPERLFLAEESPSGAADMVSYVHPKLMADCETLSALKELGLKPPSPTSIFGTVAKRVLESDSHQDANDALYREFWVASRKLSADAASDVIRAHNLWPQTLRILTHAGNWRPPAAVLLPGGVVSGHGIRDDVAAVDIGFHEQDGGVLRALGVTEFPQGSRDLSLEAAYDSYRDSCRSRYCKQDNLPHDPRRDNLDFMTSDGVGPLEVLTVLSDEGKRLYTEALLSNDATYGQWTMWHKGTNKQAYPKMNCESLTIHMLREHGRIPTSAGYVPLADALGPTPRNPEALHKLLALSKADKIKGAFELAEPTPEYFGEADPIPVTDVWPGLEEYLPANRKRCRIVACERILVVGQSRECVLDGPDIFLTGAVDDDQQRMLQLVLNELNLPLSSGQVEAILQRRTPAEIEERRNAIRQFSNDAERLLAAVGAPRLRSGLPSSLLAVLEKDTVSLTGVEIAEATIATYHTDALRQYSGALDPLGPPSRWAGSARAVRFVRALGFSAEWAGERNLRLEPFLEVEGRYRLPELHRYQKIVVRNVRKMLCDDSSDNTLRRGLVSMPTGSGKTRVAVQAIVEAMRDDKFVGGILWVADRGELCEQAVESWRQVWSSIGQHEARLRISRMWDRQPKPLPTSELHVVVATIQTLNARLSNGYSHYDFLRKFKLIVFDEAHRSIAPTFTSVMDEIGFTRRQEANEPFLLGLTATPYRGYNEEETRWLASRYGGNRLDAGAFESDDAQDVIQELQCKGVLAQADHETIEGETFSLEAILEGSPDTDEWRQELEKWRALPWLPRRVEDKIAQSAGRTRRIIEAYEDHIEPDWPTLIFATSVEHSQTVAALLNRRGIRSRPVSGDTETAARRRIVDEFRRGEIKALVNYGVFREGFDAPKTRAIIVARPVYSPNLYFQMIGRGLRGPLNGGDERCIILNVRDNIENFDRKLAFSELDWLWA